MRTFGLVGRSIPNFPLKSTDKGFKISTNSYSPAPSNKGFGASLETPMVVPGPSSGVEVISGKSSII